jgi:hypothetical protein
MIWPNHLDALLRTTMSWNQVLGNTTQNCFKHGECSKQAKETEKTIDTQTSGMIVSDSAARMATDQNISAAAKLTEDSVRLLVPQTRN